MKLKGLSRSINNRYVNTSMYSFFLIMDKGLETFELRWCETEKFIYYTRFVQICASRLEFIVARLCLAKVAAERITAMNMLEVASKLMQ